MKNVLLYICIAVLIANIAVNVVLLVKKDKPMVTVRPTGVPTGTPMVTLGPTGVPMGTPMVTMVPTGVPMGTPRPQTQLLRQV